MSDKNLYDKALDFVKKKNYPEAIRYFDQMIALNPKDADAISERGVSRFHLKDLNGAMKDMNKSLELQPDNPYRYASRAYIRDQNNDTEGAIEDYKKAIELDPEDAISQNNLGMLEEKLGYMTKAKKRFEIADSLASIKDQPIQEAISIDSNDAVDDLLDELDIKVVENKSKKTSLLKYMMSIFISKKNRQEYWQFLIRTFFTKKNS